MARLATKAAGNVFYLARMRAAKTNDRYSSREGAAGDLGMDSSRLAKIELGNINPNPDDIVMMQEMYRAPELSSTYCHRYCPLGADITVPDTESLDRITVRTMCAAKSLQVAQETLLEITQDGVIDPEEIPALLTVMTQLEGLNQIRVNLKNYIAKNNLEVKT